MRARMSAVVLSFTVIASLFASPVVAGAAVPSAGTYTVQEGDFLYLIASKAGVSIDALLKVNTVELDDIIIPGQKIVIPVGGKVPTATTAPVPAGPGPTSRTTTPATPATTVPAPAADPPPGSTTYTVVPGDMPIAIAYRFGVSPDTLLKLNRLNMQSVIVPGQKLVIPAGAVVPASSGNSRIDTVIAAAKAQIGKPYKFGYAGPNAFDCSGLMRFAFAKVGLDLLHHTLLQKNAFPAVAVADLRPGDIVFFHEDFHHEGLYLGNSTIIQAPAPGMNVQVSWIPLSSITAAVRPISD